jgi:glucose/arabinose dehydrogenase
MRYFFLLALLTIYTQVNAQVSLELNQYASGFAQPVDVVHAGDERLFVVEKAGRIRIIDGDANVLTTPFLDIDPKVNSFASERGLLGLAFHPDYANNGYFYVNYTNNGGDTRISRFSVSENDPNVADPDSEKVLMEIDQPFSNHNGGCVRFGPDGYLYIGTGDGGSGGDPINAGQDRQTLLGKMLRIDVDNGDPYGIPEDNPFMNDDETLDEVWAVGLRNPWRYSFDRLTGDLWMADVGQNDWEEIDMEPADSEGGENYGWRCLEGFENFNLSGCSDVAGMIPPVHVYANTNSVGCSVTGGNVYRGDLYPEAYGWYVYGDFCSGRIWALYQNQAGEWVNFELLNTTNSEIASFGEDVAGEMYMVGISSGRIFRLDFECNTPANPQIEGETVICNEGEAVVVQADDAPDGYSYQWFINGEPLEGEAASFLTITEAVSLNVQLVAGGSSCISNISSPVDITVAEFPDVLLTVDGNELSAVAGFESYQWLLDGQPIDGATTSTFIVEENGNYSVLITDEDGCSRESEAFTIVNTDETLKIKQLLVTPNPFTESVQLTLEPLHNGLYQFRLLDVSGKEVWTEKYQINDAWSGLLPVEQLVSGKYFLEVTHKNKKMTVPLVKQ